MTKKSYRIVGVALLGLGLAVQAMELFSRGITTMGMTGLALLSIGFVVNLVALVKGW